MSVSEFSRQFSKRRLLKRIFRLRIATLVMLSIVIAAGAIVVAWFAGEGTISQLFAHWYALQDNPPLWLKAPKVDHEKYLLLPTITLLVGVITIMKLSPRPRSWSRWLVVGILLVLMGRYIIWRSLSTLNLADPLNGVFSLWLFLLEMLLLLNSTIQLILMLNVKDRRYQVAQLSLDVISGRFTPSVDILIPTYNEADFILKRTIIGCQAINYPYKTIYLLDDTQRPEIQELANELGCNYITRPNNLHAKAGNLNHALSQTNGELIAVFDADFIPTKNFLHKTAGFFQNEKVGLVQTPQSFYNADPIAHNLGLEDVLTPEEEVFYRQIQPIRDGVGGVVCSGTSFVVRRSALEKVGGFVTHTLSEDYFTGIRIAAFGYQLIYLDEKLSAGLAAETINDHAAQRLRWVRGTLQSFFIKENPLTIPGLQPIQRLAHFEGILHWFTSFPQLAFLTMPLAYSFFGVIPIRANVPEVLYFFIPYYGVQISVFAWLNYRSRSAMLSEIYSLVLSFPLALTVIKVLFNPFSQGFKVTPKGVQRDRISFNWNLAWPLLILFIATAISLWRNLGMALMHSWAEAPTSVHTELFKGIGLGWIWSLYNLLLLGVSLLILVDVPKPDLYEWFDLQQVVRLKINQNTVWGITDRVSEVGALIGLTDTETINYWTGEKFLPSCFSKPIPVTLEIMEDNLQLSGVLTDITHQGNFVMLKIIFDSLNLEQQRRLIELLYCRPGQWQRRETPGELQSLLLLFKILLKPRILFEPKEKSVIHSLK